MKKQTIKEIFTRFQEKNPHPETELVYINPYTLLVAVVLSAQATDKGVNKATADLFAYVQTPGQMLDLGLEGLKNHIKTINFFNTKAKNILALSEILVRDYKGEVPSDRKALESLPGVGRKTANVVLNVVFGQETMAVDTHIFRVCNRTGLAVGKTPLAVELALDAVTPKPYRQHAHHWLVLHGRYVCVARKPLCAGCLINDLCEYEGKESLHTV
ncbi:endonuclease III [Candidatus Finniella inopinata]|uniref:Endonuclease III n=1 Tax=Candidatus Finniella inopinata TaxID=1696036 RepID=A0A4Q7DHR3_9PROT|nr:endonuclease III [Candidatus Finniella inopinata]RZI46481.1 endonuclease III [Candidatus Finniella inopinata]